MKIWKPTENTAYNSTFTCNYVTQQPYTITTSKQRYDSAIQEHVDCKMTNGRNAAIICCKIKYRTIPSFCLKHAYGLQCRFICNRIRNFFHVSMHCAHQNNFCEVGPVPTSSVSVAKQMQSQNVWSINKSLFTYDNIQVQKWGTSQMAGIVQQCLTRTTACKK